MSLTQQSADWSLNHDGRHMRDLSALHPCVPLGRGRNFRILWVLLTTLSLQTILSNTHESIHTRVSFLV